MENRQKETGVFDSLIKKIITIMPKWIKPNHITIFRLVLVFVLILLFLSEYYVFAFIIFLIASFSDAIDGALARQRKLITKVGSAIDPLIDKILIIVLIILFAKFLPWQIVEIILIIEVGFIIGAYIFYKKGKKVKANIFGKLKMNSEILGIILLFAKLIWEVNYFDQIIVIIFVFVIIFSAPSLLKNF